MTKHNLMERARNLVSASAVIALPLAVASMDADAAQLSLDSSFAGEYSSSGFFMSWIDDDAADGLALNLGFKLFGEKTVTDSIFWTRTDPSGGGPLSYDIRRADVSGIAFAWGGRIDGPLQTGDSLVAPYEFNINVTNTPPPYSTYNHFGVSWSLTLGLRNGSYSPSEWQTAPNLLSAFAMVQSSGFVTEAGEHLIKDSSLLWVEDWMVDWATDWFVLLAIEWYDALALIGAEDTHGAHNGDWLTVIIPDRSIDVDIRPASAVPEPATYGLMLAGLGLMGLIRRQIR